MKPHIDMAITRLQNLTSSGDRVDLTRWYNFITFDSKFSILISFLVDFSLLNVPLM